MFFFICKLMFLTSMVHCTPCLKKTVQNIICQISTNCENLWHKDGKEVQSFSTSPKLCQRTTASNADVPNCYITTSMWIIEQNTSLAC